MTNWCLLWIKQPVYLNDRHGTGIPRTSFPYTGCPPADLKIWKCILVYAELLLGLSAKTMSKGLLLLFFMTGRPFYPQMTWSITPQPSLLRRKRLVETRVRQQMGFPTQDVKPSRREAIWYFLLVVCRMAARQFLYLKIAAWIWINLNFLVSSFNTLSNNV